MNIVVTYRRTSRMSIRINRQGQVRVSAPYGVKSDAIMTFVNEHREWIAAARQRILQKETARQLFFNKLPLTSRKQVLEYAKMLDVKVRPWISKYSQLLGRSPLQISYGATKTQWGSCQPIKRHIRFSLYLLLLPDWCIEHVVAHEMCHLFVPNHGPKFYELMDRCFPRWHEARRATNRICKMGGSENEC